MTNVKQAQGAAAHALACAALAHAAPQSEAFRTAMLKQAVDAQAEYTALLMEQHYTLDPKATSP